MNRKSLVKIGITIAILTGIALSGFLFSSPTETEVEEVNLGLGVEGYELEEVTDTFYENQYVSLTVEVSNLQAGSEVYLKCYYGENEFVEPNDMTSEVLTGESLDGNNLVFSYFPKENRWRADNYRMDVILDNKTVKIKKFEVIKAD